MTNVLLDTNIILNLIRARNYQKVFEFVIPENGKIFISIVSEAEIRSIAIRQNWGKRKLNSLDGFLLGVSIVEVNPLLVPTYAQIDSYSQRKNTGFGPYPFKSARNMGKNDLWIASVAAILNLQLITTDADFNHLHGVFFEVRKIDPAEFKPFI
jgi:tRNA(fMet)-specific endonuclease VapC